MDGVVLRGRGTPQVVYDRAAKRAVDEIGVEPSEHIMSLLRAHGYVTVARGCSLAGIEPREFWRLKEKHACEVCHERLRDGKRGVYDDTDAVEKLADETTVALVSNNRQDTVDFVADHFDLPFDLAHGREPTPEGFARRKSFPDLLVEASDALGFETQDSLYVGDRRKDVVATKAAGMEAVYLRRSHNDDVPLPKGADHELGSLDDLLRVIG
jgi:phosphoglycolate phosphatase-like HAD superfamily hydrolase